MGGIPYRFSQYRRGRRGARGSRSQPGHQRHREKFRVGRFDVRHWLHHDWRDLRPRQLQDADFQLRDHHEQRVASCTANRAHDPLERRQRRDLLDPSRHLHGRGDAGDGEGVIEDTIVDHPELSLFWDSTHPTTQVHQILGNEAYLLVVPEPGTAVLVIFAFAALVAVRSNSRRFPRMREARR